MGEGNLNFGASPETFRRAKELREQMTFSEQILWEKVRAGKLNGLKFRRQHPAGKYILDFYCHEFKLVIELDGEIHSDKDQIERDKGRSEDLIDMGMSILRFRNDEIINNPNHILTLILNHLEKLKS